MRLIPIPAGLLAVWLMGVAAWAGPRISVFKENPHYLAFDGEPVFFLGATHHHSWTPISRPQVDFVRELDRLAGVMERIGSPHVRGLVRCLPYDPMNHMHDGEVRRVLHPWKRLEDGRHDLEQFEAEWEGRFREFLGAARERRILVCVELWDDWSVTRGPGGAYDPKGMGWNGHPFNPDNNVNYGRDVLPRETRVCDAPFYLTIPARENNPAVLRLQKRYADKLAEIISEYPNVILNIANESRASLEWSRFWAEYMRDRLPEGFLIGDMPSTNRRDGGGECDDALNPLTLATDARYDFADVAQGVSGHEFGGNPIRQALGGGERLEGYFRAAAEAAGPKPLIVTKDYMRESSGGTVVLWSRFVGGAATARFHRLARNHGPEVSDFQFAAIEKLGRFIAETEFWKLRPQRSAVRIEGGEGANVLAGPEEYVIQILRTESGGSLALPLQPGSYDVRWLNPEAATDLVRHSATLAVTSSGEVSLKWPEAKPHWILHMKKKRP